MKKLPKEKVAAEFGSFIREARENLGLLQADVAKKVGISRAYYSMIEAGKREIYFSLALDICDALKLDLNEFRRRLK